MANETTKIRLYGPIGGMFGVGPQEVIEALPESGDVAVHIHSPGGVVGDGIAIYHALRQHKGTVTTVIDGDAHSIASVVFLAGDNRNAYLSSRMLTHNPWIGPVAGNADELRDLADRLDETSESIVDIYESRTGMGRQELYDLMKESRYMRGSEMQGKGFATALVQDEAAETQIAALHRWHDGQVANENAKTEHTMTEEQKPIDEIVEEVAEEQTEEVAEAAPVVVEHNGRTRAQLCEEIASMIEAHKAEITTAQAAQVEAENALAEQVAVNEELNTQIAAHDEAIQAIATERDAVTAELENARRALGDPRYVDAAAVGLDEAIEGEQEAQVVADKVDDTPVVSWAEYHAIEGSAERTKYWNEHKDELKKQTKEDQTNA